MRSTEPRSTLYLIETDPVFVRRKRAAPIVFYGPVLSDAELLELAHSRHLKRLVYFEPGSRREMGPAVYEAFAASQATRKMLRFLVTLKGFPGQMLENTDHYDMAGAVVQGWSEISSAGRALI